MALSTGSFSPPFNRWLRWPLVFLLLVLLVLLGAYDAQLLRALSKGWQLVLNGLHLNGAAAALRPGSEQQGPHRPSLAGSSYIGLYLGGCLLLLRLLLPQPRQWRTALRVYGGIAFAYFLLLLISKLGSWAWAYYLSQDLLHFLVSPLPVLALVALLRGSQRQA